MTNQNKKSQVDDRLARPGALSYIEIPSTDVRQSASFYRNVLGWTVKDENSSSPQFTDQSAQLLGRWKSDRPVSPDAGFLPYIYVEHIASVVARVEQFGGRIVKPTYAQGDLWIAILRDPSGNAIGVW